MSFYDVTASGGTTTLGAAMRIGHDLKVNAGTFTTSAASHALTVDGSVTIGGTLRLNGSAVAIRGDVTNNGTIVPGSSTLTLDGSVGQLIGGSATLSAFNLVVNDTAGVALARNLTVTRTLTLSSGPLSIGANLLTISNAIAGTPGNLVAGAASSLSVTGAGAGIVLPGSVSQLSALTLNNPNGLRAQANITIGTVLTLSAGRLDVGASTVIIGPGGSVARTAGWVIGRLEKHAANGSGVILTFEIGDATRYAPVAIGFGTVGNPGDLTASTTSGDHPDLANSGLAVNRIAATPAMAFSTGSFGDDFRRQNILAKKFNHHLAGAMACIGLRFVGCRGAGQTDGDAEKLGHQSHGIGGELAAARPRAGTGRTF